MLRHFLAVTLLGAAALPATYVAASAESGSRFDRSASAAFVMDGSWRDGEPQSLLRFIDDDDDDGRRSYRRRRGWKGGRRCFRGDDGYVCRTDWRRRSRSYRVKRWRGDDDDD